MPLIVVAVGVMLTVFIHTYIIGFMGDSIELNANFSNGHLKVMTRAYSKNMSQIPNDLALTNVSLLIDSLKMEFPQINWVPRIQFGGLIDVPDSLGQTRSQGPAMGMGLDLLSGKSMESKRLNIEKSLVRGRVIKVRGEALISEQLSEKLGISPGQKFTLIGSTMNGSMAMYNFTLAGTLSFGTEILDRGAFIVDIEDARNALDMQDAAGEIVGFLGTGFYDDDKAVEIANKFNNSRNDSANIYAPVMKPLSRQGNMGQIVSVSSMYGTYVTAIFVIAMALVLWNAGLLGSLRRYGEFGVRLAMGEEKRHVYSTLIYESIAVGTAGTVIGTMFGLLISWYLQVYGIDISGMMKGAAMLMPSVIKARISTIDFFIGFFPGLFSTVLGTMLAGIGIYKRKTSQLFKELES
jgi:putative ABC transport system permease protein